MFCSGGGSRSASKPGNEEPGVAQRSVGDLKAAERCCDVHFTPTSDVGGAAGHVGQAKPHKEMKNGGNTTPNARHEICLESLAEKTQER
jgi:hypothetical protein